MEEDSKQQALDLLFAAHPQMASWPSDHNFVPCEMTIHEDAGLWMISNFGGGGSFAPADYYQSSPVRHANEGFDPSDDRELSEVDTESGACYNPITHSCECLDEKCGDANCHAAGGMWTAECTIECQCDQDAFTAPANDSGAALSHGDGKDESDHEDSEGDISYPLLPRPNFGSDPVGHARWIVSKSLWSTLSTISSKDNEQPFGELKHFALAIRILHANASSKHPCNMIEYDTVRECEICSRRYVLDGFNRATSILPPIS